MKKMFTLYFLSIYLQCLQHSDELILFMNLYYPIQQHITEQKILLLRMFRKLYQPPPIPPERKPPATYSQQSIIKSKQKQSSYSRMHKAKRTTVSALQDFQIVSNSSYIYQGEWHGQYRNGQGIAYLKNGTLIIANWAKDQLHGRALLFTPFGALVSASFVAGKLNGWVLAMYRDKVVIANLYFQDKIDGPRLVFEGSQQLWLCSTITNNNSLIKMSRVTPGKRTQLPVYVQDDELSFLFSQIILKKNYTYGFKKIKKLKITQETIYVGFLGVSPENQNRENEQGQPAQEMPNGIGITYSVQECFVGNFRDGYLEGFGRIVFANGDIYHGGVHKGQFSSNGIYYNPRKNTTIILNTPLASPFALTPVSQPDILEQEQGYYLIDFEQTWGERISKEDTIVLSLGLQNFVKLLEKYYHQYFIEARIKNQGEGFSNVSQKASQNVENVEDLEEQQENSNDKFGGKRKGVKWVSNNQQNQDNEQPENISQEGQLDQNQKIRIKYESKNSFYSPKNEYNPMLSLESQFNSLAIKQNEQAAHKENYNKNFPKIGETKKDMFSKNKAAYEPMNINSSQSLDVNQLTFRGTKNKSNQNSARTARSNNNNIELQYSNIQQDQRNSNLPAHSYQESEKDSSNLSRLEEKVGGLMGKSTFRRKIFS